MDNKALDAVIGVILMVAITVAIAATVYVYVNDMMKHRQEPIEEYSLSMDIKDYGLDKNNELWIDAIINITVPEGKCDDLDLWTVVYTPIMDGRVVKGWIQQKFELVQLMACEDLIGIYIGPLPILVINQSFINGDIENYTYLLSGLKTRFYGLTKLDSGTYKVELELWDRKINAHDVLYQKEDIFILK